MTTRFLAGVLLLAAGAGCSARADGPPPIEEDRTACAHCGMLVSERMFAAAYRAPGQQPRVFDDIGCLLDAARREPEGDSVRFWFHDAGTREWIDGERAVFVRSPDLRTPMGGGVIAFANASAARRAALQHGGTVVPSLAALRTAHWPGARKEGGS